MLQPNSDNLDAMILEEKKRVALEFFSEAWANATQEGIEPAILAECALMTALTHLTEAEGDAHVSELVSELSTRHECGHFNPSRSLQ